MQEKEFFLYKEKEDFPEYWKASRDSIVEHISDERSLKIFEARLGYSLNLDNTFLYKVILENDVNCKLLKLLKSKPGKLYIYAAGRRGYRFLETFGRDIEVAGFIDANKVGECYGKEIISPKVYLEKRMKESDSIVITCADPDDSIRNTFIQKGADERRIYSIEKLNRNAAKNIYFDKLCLGEMVSDGAFVDGGAYDGIDTTSFYEWAGNSKISAIAIEPEEENYYECCKNLEHFDAAEVIKAGLSNVESTAEINGVGLEAKICESKNSDQAIRITTIDILCVDKKVGFIKLDVEGFEYKALEGAIETIKRDHPILAVSIYHKREDIIDIPRLILDIRDDYEFRFGHYTVGMTDTVLYAIPSISTET